MATILKKCGTQIKIQTTSSSIWSAEFLLARSEGSKIQKNERYRTEQHKRKIQTTQRGQIIKRYDPRPQYEHPTQYPPPLHEITPKSALESRVLHNIEVYKKLSAAGEKKIKMPKTGSAIYGYTVLQLAEHDAGGVRRVGLNLHRQISPTRASNATNLPSPQFQPRHTATILKKCGTEIKLHSNNSKRPGPHRAVVGTGTQNDPPQYEDPEQYPPPPPPQNYPKPRIATSSCLVPDCDG